MTDFDSSAGGRWRRAILHWLIGADFQATLRAHGYAAAREVTSNAAAPILSWIRGAEQHLAALQAGYDRLNTRVAEQDKQVAQLIARVALLESCVADLARTQHSESDD